MIGAEISARTNFEGAIVAFRERIYPLYGILRSAITRPGMTFEAFASMRNQRVWNDRIHAEAAGEWLLSMQNGDGGYARKYSLISGRDRSYIETSGYIIPTLLDLGEWLQDERYRRSVHRAGEWLLSVQNRDGSFSEIDSGAPMAFDTGQVLTGLNRLWSETGDVRYRDAAQRAAKWLADSQEADGSWRRVAYNKQPHAYYSRVAAAMLEYAKAQGDEAVADVARRHLEWVLAQQKPNGFFRHASFVEGVPAYLHTVVYILEGLLDAYALEGDSRYLEAVLKNAGQLLKRQNREEKILCSQYDEDFGCANPQKCMTGLAQWAGISLRLARLTSDEKWNEAADVTIFYLKPKQLFAEGVLRGALPASVPFWGRYGAFDFVNWGNKFFIDALILRREREPSSLCEQECFVAHAFSFAPAEVAGEELGAMERLYLEKIDECVQKKGWQKKKIRFLDLGCGRGRFIEALKTRYPAWEIVGVDPVFEGENVRRGSAYAIPFKEGYFDAVLTIEVLQHTYLDDALAEIRRVLKKNGTLLIGERNPVSGLGLLKPFFELNGKWMYAWDDPFRERWYYAGGWKKRLAEKHIYAEHVETLEHPLPSRIPRMNRYYWIKGLKSE